VQRYAFFLIYANFGEQKSNENGIFCENRRMTSDIMDDEEGGADAPRQGRNPERASMQDAGTRETAGIKCRMQEREKQPASNAVEKEERNRYHVLT
jgi:hypothetical protein